MKVKRWRKPLAIAMANTLVLLLAMVGLLLLKVDPDAFKTQLIAYFSSAGLEVHIDGNVRWRVYPSSGIRFEQLRITKKPLQKEARAGETKPLAYVGVVDLDFGLLSLIRGQFKPKQLAIANSQIFIPRDILDKHDTSDDLQPEVVTDSSQQNQQSGEKTNDSRSSIEKKNSSQKQKQQILTKASSLAVLTAFQLRNVVFVWEDTVHNQKTSLRVDSFRANNVIAESWFPITMQGHLQSDQLATSGNFRLDMQAMLRHDLATLWLEQVDIQADLQGALFGVQQVQATIGEVEYARNESRLGIQTFHAESQGMFPMLGNTTQQLALHADIGLSIQSQRLSIPRFILDAEISPQQFNQAKQYLRFEGALNIALQSGDITLERLIANGQINFPQHFTQAMNIEMLAQDGRFHLASVQGSWRSVAVTLSDLLYLDMFDVTTTQNSVNTKLTISEFSPLNVASLIKFRGKKLSHHIPFRENQDALTSASAQANIAIDWSADTLQIDELQIKVDDMQIRGTINTEGDQLRSTLKVDSLMLDTYLATEATLHTQTSPVDVSSDMATTATVSSNQQSVQAATPAGENTSPTNLYSREPVINARLLTQISFDTNMIVENFQYRQQQATNTVLRIKNDGNTLSVEAKSQALGGSMNVAAQLYDFSRSPQLVVDADLQRIDMAKASQFLNYETTLIGQIGLQASLQANGESPYQWAHSLSGSMDTSVINGHITPKGTLFTLCNTVSAIADSLQQNGKESKPGIAIKKLQTQWQIVDGVATLAEFNLRSPTIEIQSNQGTINLPNQTFHMPLAVKLQGTDATMCALPQNISVDLVCQGRLPYVSQSKTPSALCMPQLNNFVPILNERVQQGIQNAIQNLFE